LVVRPWETWKQCSPIPRRIARTLVVRPSTHLVISQGLLLKERKLVPTSWASTVTPDEVHLTVGSRLIEELRKYEP